MEMTGKDIAYDETREIPEELLEQVDTKSRWESGGNPPADHSVLQDGVDAAEKG